MRTRIASLVLAISVVALVIAGLALRSGPGEPRADLVGSAAARPPAPTTASTTTSTPPAARDDRRQATPAGDLASVLNLPPRQLTIPAIGVDVPVVSVGREPDGTMEIPGATEAGWYRFGPVPGSTEGSTVIAAHVDYGGAPGPFFDLRRLEIGKTITVTDSSARSHRYVVTERFQVAKDQLPIEDLFRNDGPPSLALITCGGAFSQANRHYQDNIVIRAVPA